MKKLFIILGCFSFYLGYIICQASNMIAVRFMPRANNEPNISVFNSLADQKFQFLKDYNLQASRVKNITGAETKYAYMRRTHGELVLFALTHMEDLKRLLIAMDWAIFSMTWLKILKRLDSIDMRIERARAHIPYGLYVSPEFKCGRGSYWIVSADNAEDVQMILESEKKPTCYIFKNMFDVQGYHHTPGTDFYVGPTREVYTTSNPNGGLYCQRNNQYKCIWKINPREVFMESVEFEPKVSYRCGPYRYYIPPTLDVRCIFSYYLYNFIFQFGYEGRIFKSDGFTFTHPNGQVFYTDEVWSDLACSNYVCKWRHYQSFFKH